MNLRHSELRIYSAWSQSGTSSCTVGQSIWFFFHRATRCWIQSRRFIVFVMWSSTLCSEAKPPLLAESYMYCADECTLRCCEKLKIAIVPSNHKIKLPFDMGFNKIEKFFFKILMYSSAPMGLKLLKIRIFHKNGLFSVIIFLLSTSSVSCYYTIGKNCSSL